ncbi:MAG: S9 family peptidase [Gemmatimonadota bacterium]|nr:MAG: S9 family peptidase [Gemmatimonadota bacterium]
MRKLHCCAVLFALTGLIAGCGAEEGRIEARRVTQYTIEDFLGTTTVRGTSFAPDKSKVLVSSNETGVYNAFAIPVAGGEPIQLTESTTDGIFVESYFPDDERFIYLADEGGNELDHVYVRELDGSVTDLTPGEGLKADFLGWAQDDRSFFVSTNERDNRFFDIYEITLDGFDRTLIYQDETGYQFADISPDKRYLVFGKPETMNDSDIYLFDRQTGVMEHLTPHEGEIAYHPQTFSPDGSSLYILTDEDSEFSYLVRHDLASSRREVVEQPDWDVWYGYFSKHGKYLVIGINNDARTEIRVYDAQTMTQIQLPEMPAGDITSVGFSRDEEVMAFYVSGSRNPRDLFVYDLSGDEPRQLTNTLNPNIDSNDLVGAEVVRFASYDGVEIPGVLYRPHQVSPEAKGPALVWVHGGPGGQSRVGYSGLIQYLVNHRYVVYAINNRGSTGYGKTFYKMDDRQHGEADLADCIASKEMLIATGYVDEDRIGIIGGSYGGYMVLAALTLAPEEFAVGVDMFGISNWIRTLESIPPWWEAFREALYTELGDPAEDSERLHRISPLFNAQNITKPLMVLQGTNDPRVLQVESDEIVEAARANGVPVEYIIFDDEGHGFIKKENQLEGYRAILEFLDQYLMGEPETIAE